MKGTFYGIGVGPGDPELLTLKARRILGEVDVICIPKSKMEKESVAWTIVQEYVPAETEILHLHMPMTQDKQRLQEAWQEGAAKIYTLLAEGKNVAFVTLGDSSLYSTSGYLMEKLKALDGQLDLQTVPGITSFAAAAAAINQPLAEGNEPLVVVPALGEGEELERLLDLFPNLVLMKVASRYEEIVTALERAGRKEAAVFVSRLGQADERWIHDLDELRDQKLDYLSLILVKKGERP